MSAVRIETIAIGDEILAGKISDSNSTFVANEVFQRGGWLAQQTVIPDDEVVMRETLLASSQRSDVVVCFGGLGPTSDDKTAQVAAELLGTTLVQHPPSLDRLKQYYQERGRVLTPQGLKQVLYPQAASPLANRTGMAPGFSFELGRATFFFLPGVPREMRAMFLEEAIPLIENKLGSAFARRLFRTWKCLNIAESDLQRLMDPIERQVGDRGWLGYRTRYPENHLTLYWKSPAAGDRPDFESLSGQVRQLLQPYAYTESSQTLEELVLGQLRARGGTIAFAESCTGGAVAARLSTIPGASDILFGGAAVYQVAAKKALLQVVPASERAAVSAQTSLLLAHAIQSLSGATVGVGITGYFGPAGGDEVDPIGTIYIALCGQLGDRQLRIRLPPRTREEMQHGAGCYALWEVLRYLGAPT